MRPGLTSALDRVEGRHERSVKVYAPAPAADTAPAERPATGAAYLQQKRQAAEARRRAGDDQTATAAAVYDALAAVSVASRRLTPQDPRLTGRTEPMTLNAAFLVEDDAGAAFDEAVSAVTRAHPDATVEVDGPWPPYSFATLE
jgi:hypothetical protein